MIYIFKKNKRCSEIALRTPCQSSELVQYLYIPVQPLRNPFLTLVQYKTGYNMYANMYKRLGLYYSTSCTCLQINYYISCSTCVEHFVSFVHTKCAMFYTCVICDSTREKVFVTTFRVSRARRGVNQRKEYRYITSNLLGN